MAHISHLEFVGIARWASLNRVFDVLEVCIKQLTELGYQFSDEILNERLGFVHVYRFISDLDYAVDDYDKFLIALGHFDALLLHWYSDSITNGFRFTDWSATRKHIIQMCAVSILAKHFDMNQVYECDDYTLLSIPTTFNLKEFIKAGNEIVSTPNIDLDEIDSSTKLEYDKIVDYNAQSMKEKLRITAGRMKFSLFDLFTESSLAVCKRDILSFINELERKLLPISSLVAHTGSFDVIASEQDWSHEQARTHTAHRLSAGAPSNGHMVSSSSDILLSSSKKHPPPPPPPEKATPTATIRELTTSAKPTSSKVSAVHETGEAVNVRELTRKAAETKQKVKSFNTTNAARDPLHAIESIPRVVSLSGGQAIRITRATAARSVQDDEDQDHDEQSTSVSSAKKKNATPVKSSSIAGPRASAISLDFESEVTSPDATAPVSRKKRMIDEITSDDDEEEDEGKDSKMIATAYRRSSNIIKDLRKVASTQVIQKAHYDTGSPPAAARGRRDWTHDEEEALIEGVTRFGDGRWRLILMDPQLGHVLERRTNIDLKDKARNLKLRGVLV